MNIKKLAHNVKIAAARAAQWPSMSLTAGAVAEGRRLLAASRLLRALGCTADAELLAEKADQALAQRAASRAWARLRHHHKAVGEQSGDESRQCAAAEAAREYAATLSKLARSGRTGLDAEATAAAFADQRHEEILIKAFPARAL